MLENAMWIGKPPAAGNMYSRGVYIEKREESGGDEVVEMVVDDDE